MVRNHQTQTSNRWNFNNIGRCELCRVLGLANDQGIGALGDELEGVQFEAGLPG